MNTKNNPTILFIDPFYSQRNINTPGIAYLRGSLEDRNIKTATINFSKFIDSITKIKFYNYLRKKNEEHSMFLPPDKVCRGHLDLYIVLLRLNFLGSDVLWKIAKETRLFNDIIEKKLMAYKNIRYIGISITFPHQLLFSLILVEYIKNKINSSIKIIYGGSMLTAHTKDFIKLLNLNSKVDYLIVGEGETPLYRLIKNKETGLPKIPNLIYLKNNGYRFSRVQNHQENFSKLSSPFYEPGDIIYLQTSRRCYWGKCSFCVADNYNFCRKTQIRDTDQTLSDLELINKRICSKGSYCQFIDSSIPALFVEQFCLKTISNPNIKNKFTSYIRCDKWVNINSLKLLKNSGFIRLMFGIETTIPRLQKIINKGIQTDIVINILNICHKLRIKGITVFFIA